ncbi:MAG: iron-containing alcohol dehydrogenase [Kineosporiaceae bacterium]
MPWTSRKLLRPWVALVDPDLLVGLTRPTIVSSGMDALSQLIEPFLSVRANPFTDALARDGIRGEAADPGADPGAGAGSGDG